MISHTGSIDDQVIFYLWLLVKWYMPMEKNVIPFKSVKIQCNSDKKMKTTTERYNSLPQPAYHRDNLSIPLIVFSYDIYLKYFTQAANMTWYVQYRLLKKTRIRLGYLYSYGYSYCVWVAEFIEKHMPLRIQIRLDKLWHGCFTE